MFRAKVFISLLLAYKNESTTFLEFRKDNKSYKKLTDVRKSP